MSAEFYAEDLGIDLECASRISRFIDKVINLRAVNSARPWAKNEMARVYVDLWSQNKMEPVMGVSKCYYDAYSDNVCLAISGHHGFSIISLREAASRPNSCFSGAKTREAIKEFAEVFYG